MNPSNPPGPLPISALQEASTRAQLRECDVVLAVEITSGNENLFFGIKVLKKIQRSGKSRALKVIRFWYDQDHGDQLEFLVAAVKLLKGSCCYKAGPNK